MQLGIIESNGKLAGEIELDQQTLTVVRAADDVIRAEDWEEYSDSFILGPVASTGDGLVYRMCIDLTDLWDAGGEGKKKYTINLRSLESDFQPLFADLADKEFESYDLAMNALYERRKQILDEPDLSKNQEFRKVYGETAWKSSHYVDDEEIPTFIAALYIVPVSVPKEVILHAVGCGDDKEFELMLDQCFAQHGDYRDYAWDLCSYGHHVPISMVTDGKHEVGIMYLDEGRDAVLKRLKEQAYAVMHIPGIFLEQRVNRLGETGWDWLKHAKAWPSMCEEKKGRLQRTFKGEAIKCNDCDKETPCRRYTIIYGHKKEWICDDCRNDWYACTDCGVLIPTTPQTAFGVDWTKINQGHYCSDCASKKFNGPHPPKVVRGGTVLSVEEVLKTAPAVHNIRFDDSWKHGDEEGGAAFEWWACPGDRGGGEEPAQVCKYVAEIIEKGSPDEDFLYGLIDVEPFRVRMGLYWRKR